MKKCIVVLLVASLVVGIAAKGKSKRGSRSIDSTPNNFLVGLGALPSGVVEQRAPNGACDPAACRKEIDDATRACNDSADEVCKTKIKAVKRQENDSKRTIRTTLKADHDAALRKQQEECVVTRQSAVRAQLQACDAEMAATRKSHDSEKRALTEECEVKRQSAMEGRRRAEEATSRDTLEACDASKLLLNQTWQAERESFERRLQAYEDVNNKLWNGIAVGTFAVFATGLGLLLSYVCRGTASRAGRVGDASSMPCESATIDRRKSIHRAPLVQPSATHLNSAPVGSSSRDRRKEAPTAVPSPITADAQHPHSVTIPSPTEVSGLANSGRRARICAATPRPLYSGRLRTLPRAGPCCMQLRGVATSWQRGPSSHRRASMSMR